MDYRTLPDEALLRAEDVYRPGPYPGGRSKWLAEVKAGRAPQPVRIGHMTAWRWGDVRRYLDRLAGVTDDERQAA